MAAAAAPAATRQILVVEDEPDIRAVIGLILVRSGHAVLTAGSVHDAIDVLERAQPDVVLLDLRLPDGDGWDVLAAIMLRAPERRHPVIILSAHADESARARAVAAGAADFIAKPFAPERLTDAIDRVLEAS